jgi:hypothetical protein
VSLAFLLRYWKFGVIAVLVVAVVGFCHARDNALAERGRAQERAHVADSTLKVIAAERKRVDTLWRHDSVRVTRYADRVIRMADTVLRHLTDTMLVKEFVRTADTTAKSCRDDLPSSCAERHRLDALEIAQWKAKAQAAPAVRPRQHWGLGTTLGPCVWYDRHTIRTCLLSLNVGFTYRW